MHLMNRCVYLISAEYRTKERIKHMNFLSKTLIFFALFFLSANICQATLINIGDDITYDDVSDLYWYNNLRSTYYTSYDEAKDFYEGVTRIIEIGGEMITLDNFHMATNEEYLGLMSNTSENIVNTFSESNMEPDEIYYVGRYDAAGPAEGPNDAFSTHYFGGLVGFLNMGNQIGDWMQFGPVAIRDEDRGLSPLATCAWGVASVNHPVNPVPEPSTMILFGAGIFTLGLVSVNKRIKQ